MTAKDFFKDDHFAAQTGVTLLEIKPGYGKVMMLVTEKHLNAGNTTQGGAIFTLADLALAAAANSHGNLALSLTSSINFFRTSGLGDTLFAEATERFIHKRTGHYHVDITNQKGELVADFEATMYRKDNKLPFNL
ncbi:hotdog fold thioesterase [uncultured Bacteroides sp.]|uniref:hotdog fold thioesterase n=1 Tax=uncultured Bacteroides sp. TaxID=162156 RepID=UPI002AAC1575|nr:hotdog fold thioesterase [uncultured Bacteroides sp.]